MNTDLFLLHLLLVCGKMLLWCFLAVFMHEVGHYVAGKSLGLYVGRFKLGIGPPILKVWVKRWKFLMVIHAIPVMEGYVRFNALKRGEKPETHARIALWRMFIVMVAGPAMNFFIALLFFCMFAASLTHGPYVFVSVLRIVAQPQGSQEQVSSHLFFAGAASLAYFCELIPVKGSDGAQILETIHNLRIVAKRKKKKTA